MKINKKSQGNNITLKILVVLIASALFFGIIFLFLFINLVPIFSSLFTGTITKMSVDMRDTFISSVGSTGRTLIPRSIFNMMPLIARVEVETVQEPDYLVDVLANKIVHCWNIYGEGRKNGVFPYKSALCSAIVFDVPYDSENQVNLADVYNRLLNYSSSREGVLDLREFDYDTSTLDAANAIRFCLPKNYQGVINYNTYLNMRHSSSNNNQYYGLCGSSVERTSEAFKYSILDNHDFEEGFVSGNMVSANIVRENSNCKGSYCVKFEKEGSANLGFGSSFWSNIYWKESINSYNAYSITSEIKCSGSDDVSVRISFLNNMTDDEGVYLDTVASSDYADITCDGGWHDVRQIVNVGELKDETIVKYVIYADSESAEVYVDNIIMTLASEGLKLYGLSKGSGYESCNDMIEYGELFNYWYEDRVCWSLREAIANFWQYDLNTYIPGLNERVLESETNWNFEDPAWGEGTVYQSRLKSFYRSAGRDLCRDVCGSLCSQTYGGGERTDYNNYLNCKTDCYNNCNEKCVKSGVGNISQITQVWNTDFDSFMNRPVYFNEKIYATDDEGRVMELSPVSGEVSLMKDYDKHFIGTPLLGDFGGRIYLKTCGEVRGWEFNMVLSEEDDYLSDFSITESGDAQLNIVNHDENNDCFAQCVEIKDESDSDDVVFTTPTIDLCSGRLVFFANPNDEQFNFNVETSEGFTILEGKYNNTSTNWSIIGPDYDELVSVNPDSNGWYVFAIEYDCNKGSMFLNISNQEFVYFDRFGGSEIKKLNFYSENKGTYYIDHIAYQNCEIADKSIYSSYPGGIVAFETEFFDQVLDISLDAKVLTSPVRTGSELYVGTSEGVKEIDMINYEVTTHGSGSISGFVVRGGRIFYAIDDTLYFGTKEHSFPDTISSINSLTDYVLVGSSGGEFRAYNDNGNEAFKITGVGGEITGFAQEPEDNNIVYVSVGRKIKKYDLSTETEEWSSGNLNNNIDGPVAVGDDYVYAVSDENDLYKVSKENGNKERIYEVGGFGTPSNADASVSNNPAIYHDFNVYFTTGILRAVNIPAEVGVNCDYFMNGFLMKYSSGEPSWPVSGRKFEELTTVKRGVFYIRYYDYTDWIQEFFSGKEWLEFPECDNVLITYQLLDSRTNPRRHDFLAICYNPDVPYEAVHSIESRNFREQLQEMMLV